LKAVVSAMTAHGLALGGVVQYRTLEANLASIGIARSLGFQPFARTLTIRLAPPR
jgi:RimJ/RimL family protein N-acetyltransferase